MTELTNEISVANGEENNATTKGSRKIIVIVSSSKSSDDNNVVLDDTSDESCHGSCEDLTNNCVVIGEPKQSCPDSKNDILVQISSSSSVLSECNRENSLSMTKTQEIFKMDGTIKTCHNESGEGIDNSGDLKPDLINDSKDEVVSFDYEDFRSDYGDDDDDFSPLLDDTNAAHVENVGTDEEMVLPKTKSSRSQLVQCPHCDKCICKRNINDHINVTHLKKTKYLCELCGEGFLSTSRVRRHKLFKHKIGFKYFQCEECTYKTPYYSTLKRHILSHVRNSSGNMLSHECELCGKQLATPDGLRSHLKAHKNGKPFKCTRCGKCFSQKGNLKCHMQSHIKEDNKKVEQLKIQQKLGGSELVTPRKYKKLIYSCDQCDKVFRWPGDLCRHKKVIHLDIKRYSCDSCPKRFSNKNSLEEHVLWHNNLKPYSCTACHKSYRSKYRMKYHFLKCHKELTSNEILPDMLDFCITNKSHCPQIVK